MGTFSDKQALLERRKINKLCPGEQAVAEAFGESRIKRKFRPDGTYEWSMPFKPNDGHGRPTKDGAKVMDLMSGYWRADSERHTQNQSKVERVALRDEAGSVHYVEPHQVEGSANSNRWHSPGRIVGLLATAVNGDFCPVCDRRLTWCECLEAS